MGDVGGAAAQITEAAISRIPALSRRLVRSHASHRQPIQPGGPVRPFCSHPISALAPHTRRPLPHLRSGLIPEHKAKTRGYDWDGGRVWTFDPETYLKVVDSLSPPRQHRYGTRGLPCNRFRQIDRWAIDSWGRGSRDSVALPFNPSHSPQCRPAGACNARQCIIGEG